MRLIFIVRSYMYEVHICIYIIRYIYLYIVPPRPPGYIVPPRPPGTVITAERSLPAWKSYDDCVASRDRWCDVCICPGRQPSLPPAGCRWFEKNKDADANADANADASSGVKSDHATNQRQKKSGGFRLPIPSAYPSIAIIASLSSPIAFSFAI